MFGEMKNVLLYLHRISYPPVCVISLSRSGER